MLTQSTDIQERVDAVWPLIINSKSTHRRDLLRMFHHCAAVNTELSKEAINCRRVGKITIKYSNLAQELDELVSNLEQYVTFAILLNT